MQGVVSDKNLLLNKYSLLYFNRMWGKNKPILYYVFNWAKKKNIKLTLGSLETLELCSVLNSKPTKLSLTPLCVYVHHIETWILRWKKNVGSKMYTRHLWFYGWPSTCFNILTWQIMNAVSWFKYAQGKAIDILVWQEIHNKCLTCNKRALHFTKLLWNDAFTCEKPFKSIALFCLRLYMCKFMLTKCTYTGLRWSLEHLANRIFINLLCVANEFLILRVKVLPCAHYELFFYAGKFVKT